MTKPLRTINFGGEDTYHLAPEWNNVDDRPFGEETVYGDTLTWDGNTEGLEAVDLMGDGSYMYKVCENVPASEQLTQICLVTLVNGNSGELAPIEEIPNAFTIGTVVLIVLEDISEGGMTLKKGVHFAANVRSLTINGYNGFPMKGIKQLDNKYLEPFETVGGDTLTWDGNTEGLASFMGQSYKVTDVCPTLAEAQNGGGAKVYNGTEFVNETITSDAVMSLADELGVAGFMILGSIGIIAVGVADNCEVDGEAIEKGLYFTNVDGAWTASLTINGYTGFTTTKLKEEYLPSISVDLSNFTEQDGANVVSGVNYTPIHNYVKNGGAITCTITMDGVTMYLTPVQVTLFEGDGLYVYVLVDGNPMLFILDTP